MRCLIILVLVFAANTVFASETRSVVYNGSRMKMQIGDASEDVSHITIHYSVPSAKMRSLVQRGTLFFAGSIGLDTGGIVEGHARIYKFGCKPFEYYVVGVFEKIGRLTGRLKLVGPAPVFKKGKGKCDTVGYVFNGNSELLFTPLAASGK